MRTTTGTTTLLAVGLVLMLASSGFAATLDWKGFTWTVGTDASVAEVLPNGNLHTAHSFSWSARVMVETPLDQGVTLLQLSWEDLGANQDSVTMVTTAKNLVTGDNYNIYMSVRPWEAIHTYENAGSHAFTQVADRTGGNTTYSLVQLPDSTLQYSINASLVHTDTWFKDNGISFYLRQAIVYGYGNSGGADNTFTDFKATAVPEPGSLLALGVGAIGLAGSVIRRRR